MLIEAMKPFFLVFSVDYLDVLTGDATNEDVEVETTVSLILFYPP